MLLSFAPACHCPRNFTESWISRVVIVIVEKQINSMEVTSKCSKHEWNHEPHHFYGLYEYGPWQVVVDFLDLGMTVRAAAGSIMHVLAFLFCA